MAGTRYTRTDVRPQKDTALRAAVYRRISSDDEHDRLGIERQLPPCMKLAEARGAEVVKVFTDNDVSASGKKHRPDYQEMLEWVRAGKLDMLIAYDAARLTRNPRESLDLLDLADSYGIQLATTTGQYDLTTAEGRYQWRQAANNAARDREKVAELVIDKHAELRANGKHHGGQRGFGYVHTPYIAGKRVRYRIELHTAEANHVRAAKDRILRGGSISAIVKDWTEQGIRRTKGRLWDTPKVRELLTSPRIAGLRENGAEFVTAEWPAIIAREEWELLRAILGERPMKLGPKEPRQYLASNIIVCGHCDFGMVGQARHGTPAYACRRELGGCGRLHRVAAPIDEFLRDAVIDALASPAFRVKLEVANTPDNEHEIDALVVKRDNACHRLKELRDWVADPEIDYDVDDFVPAKRKLTEIIDDANAKLAELRTGNALIDLPETVEGLEAYWTSADLDERRALLRLCFVKVVVKAPGGGKRFAPTLDHVEPVWRV